MITATIMGIRIRMARMTTIDDLHLVQWLSPAFPIGSFAYSQGLETAIVDGGVRDAASLADWVGNVLVHGSGRADAILLAAARRPDADLTRLSELALAYATSAERATEMQEQGRAFLAQIRPITGRNLPDMPLAVAVGAVTAGLSVPTEGVLALWLHGLAAQLVQAGVRFIPLGQSAGQAILSGLAADILALAQEAARLGPDDIGATTIGADLAAMRHETLNVRIFRS